MFPKWRTTCSTFPSLLRNEAEYGRSGEWAPPGGRMVIRPPAIEGAAFTTAAAGDMLRGDRREVSEALGISPEWATVGQRHGAEVREVDSPGPAGAADALVSSRPGLPMAVFTADCAGVVLHTDRAAAVVHAGWRGAAARAVEAAARRLGRTGTVRRAVLGPMIGPCCFEVGEDVLRALGEWEARTDWGSPSVDLPAALRAQVPQAQWWSAGQCTRCGEGWFSHRADASPARMAAIGWLP